MDEHLLDLKQNSTLLGRKKSSNRFLKNKVDSKKFRIILDNLILSLKSSDPYKIILFGSYANGNPNENSDIDLLVILDNNHVSRTYQERLNKKIRIKNSVIEINRKVPLDILVYSKEELNIIKKNGNYFIDEIEKTGKVIYEKAS
jgi:predicted nucleotidyltransferase